MVGDHVLTVNDLMGPKRPEDSVAVGTYGVDTWGQPEYDKHPIPLTPGGYGIPLRALLTKGMENLMVVGKCLSATHLAMSAVRVQCIVGSDGTSSRHRGRFGRAAEDKPPCVAARKATGKAQGSGNTHLT